MTEYLEDLEIIPQQVTLMRSFWTKELPILAIKLEKSAANKRIVDIKNLGDLDITVDMMRKKKEIFQIRICQGFGRIQLNCKADYKCVKCGKGYESGTCELPGPNEWEKK